MISSHFDNLPKLTKEDAFNILSKNVNFIDLASDYYKAIFHLAKYPSADVEDKLIAFLKLSSDEIAVRIGKRKAIEVLASFKCQRAIPLIAEHLNSNDQYIVENSIIALQLLNCKNPEIVNHMSNLLDQNKHNQRILIQTISRLGGKKEIKKIAKLIENKKVPSEIRGAAIAAIIRINGEMKYSGELKKHLRLTNQQKRLLAVKDIIDSERIDLLPYVLKSPVPTSFRVKAIKALWPKSELEINNMNLFSAIESTIIDDPKNINFIKLIPNCTNIDSLVKELFSTDFDRSYQALYKLSDFKADEIWDVLKAYTYNSKKDYGVLYFFVNLFGLKSDWSAPALNEIRNILEFALSDTWPDFMKFRAKAITSLSILFPVLCKKKLSQFLNESLTPYWINRFAALMCIEKFLDNQFINKNEALELIKGSLSDNNFYVCAKAKKLLHIHLKI